MNNEVHKAEQVAWERGYGEAMLDMYCFLTGDEQILNIDPKRLAMIKRMVDQVNATSSKLQEVWDEPGLLV